jgi:hypothetical protein
MPPFDYPAAPIVRSHGPRGYEQSESYRPWLRDEFAFRCVYCLCREQWGRVTGEFNLDHFVPQKIRPRHATTYDNLVYACARCNRTKSAQRVPDPLATLTLQSVRVHPDGSLEGCSSDAKSLILKLDLNGSRMVSWRLLWMRIVELAAANDEPLYQRIMGYPNDLPDLARLRPPGGNARPPGVSQSHFARAARGELPATY